MPSLAVFYFPSCPFWRKGVFDSKVPDNLSISDNPDFIWNKSLLNQGMQSFPTWITNRYTVDEKVPSNLPHPISPLVSQVDHSGLSLQWLLTVTPAEDIILSFPLPPIRCYFRGQGRVGRGKNKKLLTKKKKGLFFSWLIIKTCFGVHLAPKSGAIYFFIIWWEYGYQCSLLLSAWSASQIVTWLELYCLPTALWQTYPLSSF